ncbi:hypothetical protein HMI54_015477 [Coelomomyces lativittatus]|nr:hypothetical protein HMI55_006139 [Coelomomyces lativittatus]KAJ1515530.1 hypothetical protein HMI56_003924 [Coelomomyces lativittatus]KAJ1518509.1 hypothetical protein HMI54_015477 [Coelomomyces lativittatus]
MTDSSRSRESPSLNPTQPKPSSYPSNVLQSSGNPAITVMPLGAGQDVGKSCIMVSFQSGRTVMLDCGMHMGYQDDRRFPDFSYLTRSGTLDSVVDAVLISHFHLDHCGALPYMTEKVGYNGPLIMSHPTKLICPILLEDFRRISGDRRGNTTTFVFSNKDIRHCLSKVTCIEVHESLHLRPDLEIKAYYAGHVLGAVMFYVKSGNQSVLYTGDYNMTPDRHLGSAWVDACEPDLLITESTYATTIRDSKRSRERDFLRKVQDCIQSGGKVLLPVFAVGRAQELAILLESLYERIHCSSKIYFTGGLTEKSLNYYRLFVHWTNQKLKHTLMDQQRNPFDFKHIHSLPHEGSVLERDEPMVVFASPGMLHSGLSLEIFKKWASDPRNCVILPGYCVPGTVGAQLLAAPSTGARQIQLDKTTSIECHLKVENLSFSAHADAKGILQLMKMCRPKQVMLVHGEKKKMHTLKSTIEKELGLPTYCPPNHSTLVVSTPDAASQQAYFTVPVIQSLMRTFHHQLADLAIRLPCLGKQVKGIYGCGYHRDPAHTQVTCSVLWCPPLRHFHFSPLPTHTLRYSMTLSIPWDTFLELLKSHSPAPFFLKPETNMAFQVQEHLDFIPWQVHEGRQEIVFPGTTLSVREQRIFWSKSLHNETLLAQLLRLIHATHLMVAV